MDRTLHRKNTIYFATWLRAFSVFLILLCHLSSSGKHNYLITISQFFNIGVEIFFILSGFLFGAGGVKQYSNPIKWYVKRLKRIYIPLELFIVILLAMHIILGNEIIINKWIFTALGIQGVKSVHGAEQIWFISALLICYIVTPVISKFYDIISSKRTYLKFVELSVIAFLPFIFALIPNETIFIFFSPVSWYSLAYFYGRNYGKFQITIKHVVFSLIIMLFVFGVRIVSKKFLDTTIWYDRIIVEYVQNIAAFCIFVIFMYVFKNIKPNRIVQLVSDISFEIYLYHCMFIGGPVSFLGMTPFWITDCILIIAVSFIIAFIMNKISNNIMLVIDRRKKHDS